MKLKMIAFVISLLAITGCSNSQKASSEDFKLSEIVITNAYVQESVAGIEGGASVFEFLMNIKVPSPNLVPDSVFYQGMGTKLILKDANAKQYYGRVSMKVSDLDLDKGFVVRLKFNGNTIDVSPKYKVMDKMYLP